MVNIEYLFKITKLKKLMIDSEEMLDFFWSGLVLVIIYLLLRFFIFSIFKTASKLERFQKNRLETIKRTLNIILKWIFVFVFFILILKKFDFNINTILTGAGALGAALVLIFQNSLRDIFTGWLFAFEDVFRQGEEVMINNTFKGKVESLRSRYLILKSDDKSIYYIPFGKIDFIQNLSRDRLDDTDTQIETE